MSDAPASSFHGTFSAPSSPTTGLQRYDLDRRVKTLAPETSSLLRLSQRMAIARRAKLRGRKQLLKKDGRMKDAIQPMVATLSKSVADIVAAGGDQQDRLLEKSFQEFGDALIKQYTESLQADFEEMLAKRAPDGEEPLFKGLGTVGRVASLVSLLADRISAIKKGQDYPGQTPPDGAEADTPDDEVQSYLDMCLAGGEMALRSAVNGHVQIADDDGDEDTMVMKLADGQTTARIKFNIEMPEELAKFATDPDALDQILLDRACDTLLAAGVSEEVLGKVLAGDDLAKAAPPSGVGGADATNNGAQDDGSGDDDPAESLMMVGRLLAAAMIQLNGTMESLGLTGDASGGADADPAASDQGAAAVPQADQGGGAAADDIKSAESADATDEPAKKKNPFAKVADPEVAELRKNYTDLAAKLERVLALPGAPKAIVGPVGTLSKAADAPGVETPLTDEEIATALEKIADPTDKAMVLYKIQRGGNPRELLGKLL